MFAEVLGTSLTKNELQVLVRSEAATGGVLLKKLFLEISQNLQENSGTGVSLRIL